jgi:TatD DNase family protein
MKNYLIDTHTHINDIDGLNVDEIIKNAAENGVKKLVVPAAALSDFEKIINLCERYENVFGYLGIHPEELKDWSDDVIDKIKLYVKNPKIVGIGEIGLDYYWDKSQVEKQKEIFIKQIELANELNLPINIHSREASQDTFNILKEYNKDSKIIMHCFSGSPEFAKMCLNMGMYIALGGVVTFKKAIKVKEVAKIVPLDRLLLETDAPYMTPVPYRGETNQPMYVKFVAQEIANVKGITFEDVQNATTENAERILGI